MGTGIRYTDEFKQEAVNQIVIHGYDVAEVASRLGLLGAWMMSGQSCLASFKRIPVLMP